MDPAAQRSSPAGAVSDAERGPSRLVLALVLAFGVLLQAPSLGLGFYADDYVHQIALGDAAGRMPMRAWSLYDFGTRADWESFEATEGAFPWWTSADWAVRFFRPLASLSLALDHAVWGSYAPGYHLTSLCLYALLLALVHRLFRRLGLAPRAALLGLLLFELGDASVIPVGWISNRNSLLEALFTAAAVGLVARERGAAGAGAIAGALALAAAAAASKESGVVAFALVAGVLALSGRGDPSGRPRAFAGAAVALVLALAFVAGLALAGFGTRSLFYVTPWREPLRFAGHVGVLLTAGLLSLAGPFPLDVATLVPKSQPVLALVGLLLGLPLALWVARRVAGRTGAAVLALWTFATLVPQGGVEPSDRLLFVPTIGAAGLLALAFEAARERARAGRASRAARILAALLLGWATLGSGVSLLVQELGGVDLAEHLRAKALATELGPRSEGPLDVLVLQTESQMQGFTLGETWHGEGGDPSVRFALLQAGARPVRWTRVSDDAFELESLGEPFLTGIFERVYLAREPVFVRGETWRTPLFTVEALAGDAAGLRAVRVELTPANTLAGCTVSLDDPALRFVRPIEGVLTPLAPPAVGESLVLDAPVPSRPFVP
jgi:hypothetical protein